MGRGMAVTQPKDIGPNLKLNRTFAGLMLALGLCFVYIAYDITTYTQPSEWGFPAVPAAIALAAFGLAIRNWNRAPRNTARVQFRDGGFLLETRQVLRRDKSFDLDWSDIREINKHDHGLYGGRFFRIWYGTGRQSAMFHSMWTDTETLETLERFRASAEASGYGLEKQKAFFKNLKAERWVVTPAP